MLNGIDNKNPIKATITVVFFLSHLVIESNDSTGPSSNEIDDEIDANIILKKNPALRTLPKGIVWNMLGTVTNNNDGPPSDHKNR